MHKLRGLRGSLIVGIVGCVGAVGCERSIPQDPALNPNGAVVAQFDPANPIPLLNIVPSPTALAQKLTGGLNVPVDDCEKPSQKECLALAPGWPLSTPITLYFSGDIDPASIDAGIRLLEVSNGTMTPVPFMASVAPRDPPPEACGIDPAIVPPGVQVVLSPMAALKNDTQYMVAVISSPTKGLRDANMKPVDPSALFSLLNVPSSSAPLVKASDGSVQIASGLLRSNVSSQVLAGLFPGKSLEDLTDAEKTQLVTVINGKAADLYTLYSAFFDPVITALVGAGVATRSELILVNTWTTGPAPSVGSDPALGELEFDPANQKFPFPNVALLTATTGPNLNDLKVAIPILDTDSPTAAGLKTGLNTLDGFSTTAPITLTASHNVDPATLASHVVMYKVNDQGMAVTGTVTIAVRTATVPAGASAPIQIFPLLPLEENTTYVIAVKVGLLDTDGKAFRRSQTYNLASFPLPLVVDGAVNPAAMIDLGARAGTHPVAEVLKCSQVEATGMLLSDAEVLGTASALEFQVKRARWRAALDALGGVGLSETQVLMAWTHKTQSITKTVDTVKHALLPGPWQTVRTTSGTPELLGPVFTATGAPAIRALLQVNDRFCLALCAAGALTGIAPNQCADAQGHATAAVAAHPGCGLVAGLVAGRIGAIRGYLLANYEATSGNPYIPGEGTFTPAGIVSPRIEQHAIWVVTGTVTAVHSNKVMIFQHGLGSVKEAGFYIANTFAPSYATVLMDLPFHGARASDVVDNATGAPCPDAKPENVVCDQTGACTGGCDGQQDPSGTGFLSANIFAARDNFRQSTIDQLTLIRALQNASVPAGPLQVLDTTHIGYVGQSLGGITGGNLMAYASPEIQTGVLNVPGGGLVNILLGTVPQIAAPLFVALHQAGVCDYKVEGDPTKGCKPTPAFAQFLVTAQWALDPGDPLANSIGVHAMHNGTPPITPAKILIQMAVPDRVVPNSTTRALGRAYGFDPADNSQTSHFRTYDFGSSANAAANCHAFILSPDAMGCGASLTEMICSTFGAQQAAARFTFSNGAVIGGRKAVGFPPVAPFGPCVE
ncbi:MAG: Ig-like domain-containing protein [Myxococcota bacterium]